MNFEKEQIFNGSYPPEAAIWCNENNCYIEDLKDGRYQIKEVPKPTLETLKKQKLDELSRIASSFEVNENKEMYFTSSLGFRCNGDRRTGQNLNTLIEYFDDFASGEPKTIEYKDFDNKNQKLNLEQLQTLLKEHSINGISLYHQKWPMQEKIQNANSEEELNFEIEFVMQDFSK